MGLFGTKKKSSLTTAQRKKAEKQGKQIANLITGSFKTTKRERYNHLRALGYDSQRAKKNSK